MFLSVFEVFKIGVGPSSSHTMGPMSAALRFLDLLASNDWPRPAGAVVSRLRVSLHGSLAYTGLGHATDRAVILGLAGEAPDTVDPDAMDDIIAGIRATGMVTPPGHPSYRLDCDEDVIFEKREPLPGHANGMVFLALNANGNTLLRQVYYSIGGGFVLSDTELAAWKEKKDFPAGEQSAEDIPFPFRNAAEMLAMAGRSGLSIAAMKRANEETRLSRTELDEGLDRLWDAMDGCIDRGLNGEGVLPGGLNVKRRAGKLHEKLSEARRSNQFDPMMANDWLAVFAMAVNEENAAGGRVVTAPTNGAAGVVPATLRYFREFQKPMGKAAIRDFLLTAAAIGGIIKSNASISGAEVGCQGEVGSASAMAAAGLAAAMGGTPEQVENAAEIALEHHLGMTCDPIAGLVQVPCIERNALGAVKAVTAASLALKGDGSHFVPLDNCIETMRQTGGDMHEKYKETSTGGLAVNVVDC
ncbi:L-serine ammonia-lyase [Martelella endophytica]|uniref:L-serine dehydratase n=1 Tax=Martelella endophytica TaxID=1486262 RepID=A0A0D5LTV0_MAREN|nr:L-serine ammonia-lyase [Martelella endophytica]AJY47192.1 serine dehydratase [Martelella endophytica]